MKNNTPTIASFTVDHDLFGAGFYVSRRDGDVTTYDMRTRRPNGGDYMSNLVMHSVEHMFATYIRASDIGRNVLYFGPMGCQTGFYLLVRGLSDRTVLSAVLDVLEKIIGHDREMFGNTRKECGNYKNLDLETAKEECRRYLAVLRNETSFFVYPDKAEGGAE